jgi:hypothetical protein
MDIARDNVQSLHKIIRGIFEGLHLFSMINMHERLRQKKRLKPLTAIEFENP